MRVFKYANETKVRAWSEAAIGTKCRSEISGINSIELRSGASNGRDTSTFDFIKPLWRLWTTQELLLAKQSSFFPVPPDCILTVLESVNSLPDPHKDIISSITRTDRTRIDHISVDEIPHLTFTDALSWKRISLCSEAFR